MQTAATMRKRMESTTAAIFRNLIKAPGEEGTA